MGSVRLNLEIKIFAENVFVPGRGLLRFQRFFGGEELGDFPRKTAGEAD